ncbi:MAG: type I DNA topoisomerase [bacterium]|nr:MAG: type I DNA topoisomerase [bacterium]
MGKDLIIVESPTKAKTIGRILGKDYDVLSSNGHVIDLPAKELAVDPEKEFTLKNMVIPSKKKVLGQISKASREAERVLLATDPDREGEAIGYLISRHLKLPDDRVYRVLFHEITKSGILKALDKPGKLDDRKFHAQQARRAIDRLVGYKLSPVLWKKIQRGLSAGRVQSVALRLICEREREIQAFIPEDYWLVHSILGADQPPVLKARVTSLDDGKTSLKNGRIPDEATALKIRSVLEGEAHIVNDLEVRESAKSPPPPFITSTLQQEAARKLRFTAKKTMMVAQQLYEGIALGERGTMGLITYMRTDSVRVSAQSVETARKQIASHFGQEFVPASPRHYRNRKGAQDAHEAVRPSQPDLRPEDVSSYLDRDQARLYELIYRRFLASQMENARIERTKVQITAGTIGLTASGQRILFTGFTALYEEGKDDNNDGEVTLPPLKAGQELGLVEVDLQMKTTQPPPRYTEATLVKTMEEKGIGRPSTYAAILDTIRKRKYVVMEDKRRFFPTSLGLGVNDYLVSRFPRLVDVQFTAHLEDELDLVEEGDKTYLQVLEAFYDPFTSELISVEEKDEDFTWGETDLTCPECSKPLMVKMSGRTGEFLACSGYPECRFTSDFERTSDGKFHLTKGEERPEKCPECDGPMTVKQGPTGPFLGCTRYPDCKGTRPFTTGIACPREGCDGQLIVRRTRKGKTFYGCSSYPKCDFAVWDEPVQTPCPVCEFPVMTRRSTKRGDVLTCANKECQNKVQGDGSG